MTELSVLWLPIVASAVSMGPFWRKDYPAVPNQDRVVGALRP